MDRWDSDIQEKTEDPTELRLEEARKKGIVSYSRDLAFIFSFVVWILLIILVWNQTQRSYHQLILLVFERISQKNLYIDHEFAFRLLRLSGSLLAVGSGIFALLMIFSTSLQTGFLMIEDAFALKWDRLDPVNNLKKIVSAKQLIEFLKITTKLAVFGFILFWFLNHLLIQVFQDYSDIRDIGLMVLKFGIKVVGALMLFLLLLAIFDFAWQKWLVFNQLKMTKQELKEELKQKEINPLVKSKIRRIIQSYAQRRMIEDVKKATVVITNPTHIAVALKYDKFLPAPKLVAKGADQMALKIKEVAMNHGIPVVENKPLAQFIYRNLKIGQFIPRELYVAVAEVLSYVWKRYRKPIGL